MRNLLRISAFLLMAIFSGSAFAVGYNCTKCYTSCKAGYYFTSSTCSTCTSCGTTGTTTANNTATSCTCPGSGSTSTSYTGGSHATYTSCKCPTNQHYDGDSCVASTVNVSYHINGGTGTAPIATACLISVNCDLTSGATTDFKRAGYKLVGWSTDSNATSGSFSINTSTATTVYAVWTACSSGTYKTSSAKANESCTACPRTTNGWTAGTGTGWTNYTSCYQTKAATDVSSYCSEGQLRQTASSSSEWGDSTVSTAFKAKAGSYVNGQDCIQCSGRTYTTAEGTQTSCTACLSAENGWTAAGGGNGQTSYTTCTETKTGSAISSYCSAGVLTKTQSSATAWATTASITTVLKANAGSYVNSQTCTQCTGATYSAGGTATACSDCTNPYTANTNAGKSAATQCQASIGCGKRINQANATSTVNCGGGYYLAAHTVNYGSTSPNCSEATGANYAANGACEQTACPVNYDDNTESGKTEASECEWTTTAGTYIANANDTRATICLAGWACPSITIPYGSAGGLIACTEATYSNAGAGSCTECPTTSDSTEIFYWSQDGIHISIDGCFKELLPYTGTYGSGTRTCYYTSGNAGAAVYDKDCGHYNWTSCSAGNHWNGDASATDCQAMGPGYWSPNNDIKAYKCPDGYSTSGNTRNSNQGAITNCSATVTLASLDSNCTGGNRTATVPSGTAAPTDCGAFNICSYTSQPNFTPIYSLNGTAAAAAEYYFNNNLAVYPMCPAVGVGYYSAAGSATRSLCTNKPSGAEYTGSAASNACPWSWTIGAGKYYRLSDRSAQTCPAGSYCPGVTVTNATNADAGITACSNKPSGAEYTGSATSNACPWEIVCAAGTKWTGGNSCVTCTDANDKGLYCKGGTFYSTTAGGTEACTGLPAGAAWTTFSSSGTTSCGWDITCGKGQRWSTSQKLCVDCAIGTYRNSNDYITNATAGTSTSCTNASAGYFVAGTAATAQVACAVGSYSVGGTGACTACQSGNTTNGTGQSSCNSSCSNNNAYDTSWATASWSDNDVSNRCVVSGCAAGYAGGGTGACSAVANGHWSANDSIVDNACPATVSGSDGTRGAITNCYYTCPAKNIANSIKNEIDAPVNKYYSGSAYPACTYTIECANGYHETNNGKNNASCAADVMVFSFNNNCGKDASCKGSMPDKSCTYGQSCVLDMSQFLRDNYNFLGWSDSSSGEKMFSNAQNINYSICAIFPCNHSVNDASSYAKTLYAVWGIDTVNCSTPGQYLGTDNACHTCPAGSFCPGGIYNRNSTEQGRNLCTDYGDHSYNQSAANSTVVENCYKTTTCKDSNAYSYVSYGNSATYIAKNDYYVDAAGGHGVRYYGSQDTCDYTVNSCKANFWLKGNLCDACPDGGLSAANNSDDATSCYINCPAKQKPTCVNNVNCCTKISLDSTQENGHFTGANGVGAYLCKYSVECATGYTPYGQSTSAPYCMANPFSISYNKNASDATGSTPTIVCLWDSDCNISYSGFSRQDYFFKGWAETPTGAVSKVEGETIKNILTGASGSTNKTFYAVWESEMRNCQSGQYLDDTLECAICTAGSFCPGGNYLPRNGANQGIYRCQDTDANYPNSAAGANSDTGCYRYCSGSSIPHGSRAPVNNTEFYPTRCTFTASCDTGYAPNASLQSTENPACVAQPFDIRFHGNGAQTPADYVQTPRHITGTNEQLNANLFARLGYVFSYWSKEVSGAKAYENAETISTSENQAFDLYAIWGECDAGYSWNGAACAACPVGSYKSGFSAASGAAVYCTACIAGSTTAAAASTGPLACYSLDYKITYHLNGGTNHSYNPGKYNNMTPNIALRAPTRAKYVFAGWFTDPLFENPKTEIALGSWGDINLYAKWTACAAGKYCPGDNSELPCATGTYSAGTAAACDTCLSNHYCVAGIIGACPAEWPLAPAGSEGINSCYRTCANERLADGEAQIVRAAENHPTACSWKIHCDQNYALVGDATINGGPLASDRIGGGSCALCPNHSVCPAGGKFNEWKCEYQTPIADINGWIRDGDICRSKCLFDPHGIGAQNQTTGACYLTGCIGDYHLIGTNVCEADRKICTTGAGKSGYQDWNGTTFGPCSATESMAADCPDGRHDVSGICVSDYRTCKIENGVGIQEWNGSAWGDCEVSACNPGWTNDPFETNERVKPCGRCNNAYDENGDVAASTYARECEIAMCMYQGEKYALENNECILICKPDSDETGVITGFSNGKCNRQCKAGFVGW